MNFTNSPVGRFIWAKGDQRFNRDASQGVKLERRFSYESREIGKLPYMLMPETLKPNPQNDGLVNSYMNRHAYRRCSSKDGKNCTLEDWDDHVSWFMSVRNALIDVPGSGRREAKWVEYVELSLPGKDRESLTAPYINNRALACATNADGTYKYSGVREDWFFVQGIGPALILTRAVNSDKGGSCIFDVARDPLNFDNADTVTFLIQHDKNGYDPNWDY